MAVADKFSDRGALIDAVYDYMLSRAGSSFPMGLSFSAQSVANDIGVSYTDGKPGYGPAFEKVFGQDWVQLVSSCATWLAAEDYFIERQSGNRDFPDTYRLSERGAKLMGCLPAILRRADVQLQPGEENL